MVWERSKMMVRICGNKYMSNHTTGAQRRNARMEKIFARAKSEGRGLVGDSGLKGHGVNSPAMKQAKSKALKKAKEEKLEARSKKAGFYVHGHKNLGDVYEA